jgi:hypothetical protein
VTTTLAPASARLRATSRPIPEVEPVTSATCPLVYAHPCLLRCIPTRDLMFTDNRPRQKRRR